MRRKAFFYKQSFCLRVIPSPWVWIIRPGRYVPFTNFKSLNIYDIKIIDSIYIVTGIDKSFYIRELFQHFLEFIHMVKVCPVFSIHCRNPWTFYEYYIVTGIDNRMIVSYYHYKIFLLEMPSPSSNSILNFPSLRSPCKEWDDHNVFVLIGLRSLFHNTKRKKKRGSSPRLISSTVTKHQNRNRQPFRERQGQRCKGHREYRWQ